MSLASAESGHRKMLELLKDLNDRARDNHPFLGQYRLRQFRERLATVDDHAPFHLQSQLHFGAGEAEMELGHVRAAIAHFEKAFDLLPPAQAKSSLAYRIKFYLAVANMRLGEVQNCCRHHTPESCIMPIQGGGLHTQVEGSSKAIQHFTELLENSTESNVYYLPAQWLLNIAYMTIGRYPDDVPKSHLIEPSAFESEMEFPRFKNVAPALGLATFNLSGGAIVDDFDNDQYLDVVTSTFDTAGPMHFFRNNRDGSFSDQTEQAGLTGMLGGLNMVQADYDNDGNLDILVLRGAWAGKAGQHPNSLLRNNGTGKFTDVTFEAGLGQVHYPTQTAAWADYDNDGDLDLYIGNESGYGFTAPSQLFRNNGDGTFTDVADQAGVRNDQYAKGVVWGDFDNDRFPDLYVSNLEGQANKLYDGQPNRLYRNNGDGTFTDVAPDLNVTGPLKSFPVWFWDYNNDGALDLFVSSYTGSVINIAAYHVGRPTSFETTCLYKGDGRGRFEEVAAEHHLTRPMLPMGANFGDLNNDGFLDFSLGTGDPDYFSLMPNLMFLNQGGKRFVDVTMTGGFGHLQKGHAIAFADLDNDGDQDVFQQMGGAYPGDEFKDALYENPGFGNHWLTIKLIGVQSNRSAIGAQIHVKLMENGTTRSVYRHVNSGGSFGCNPLRQTIGLGKAATVQLLEVYWPTTAKTQKFHDLAVDQFIQIVEGNLQYTTVKAEKFQLGGMRHGKDGFAISR